MARRHPRLHWQKTQSCGVHAWRQLRCRVQVWPHKHLGVAHQWCKCQVISARHRGCFWFLSRKTILASMMLSQFMWHERCLTPSIAPLALWLRILFDGVKVLKNGYRIHQGAWIGAEQGIVPPRLPQPQHRSASRPLPCLRSRPGACGTHAHTHTHTHTHTPRTNFMNNSLPTAEANTSSVIWQSFPAGRSSLGQPQVLDLKRRKRRQVKAQDCHETAAVAPNRQQCLRPENKPKCRPTDLFNWRTYT